MSFKRQRDQGTLVRTTGILYFLPDNSWKHSNKKFARNSYSNSGKKPYGRSSSVPDDDKGSMAMSPEETLSSLIFLVGDKVHCLNKYEPLLSPLSRAQPLFRTTYAVWPKSSLQTHQRTSQAPFFKQSSTVHRKCRGKRAPTPCF